MNVSVIISFIIGSSIALLIVAICYFIFFKTKRVDNNNQVQNVAQTNENKELEILTNKKKLLEAQSKHLERYNKIKANVTTTSNK